jgi:mRNA interferase RelE/StbE
MFKLNYSSQSIKFLKKTEKENIKRILNKLEILCKKPFVSDSKTIQGSQGLYRIRIGKYRVLYEIDYKEKTIGIIKIDKRTKIYKKL